jgi:hypothetical protein
MLQKTDRVKLERRLQQACRLAAAAIDLLTRQRLDELARDIQEQLDKPE